MKLTATQIKNAKPTGKRQRFFDGRGLYLEVSPGGGKWWRFKYRISGKEKRCSLGVYPDVSLKEARLKLDEVRKMVLSGIDPIQSRKAAKTASEAPSFEVIAREWHGKYSEHWTQGYTHRILSRLESDLFPWVGKKPISEITPPMLLETIQRVETRGARETAHRLLAASNRVFCYAMATGRVQSNPCEGLKGALSPVQGGHFAAATEPEDAARILRMIDGYQGSFPVRSALRLAPLVFVRPSELRKAEWKNIDLQKKEWRYLINKTKTQHIVPLSQQAIAIFNEIRPLTGDGQYVFPSARTNSRPLSDNALLAAMRRMGISKDEMCTHGFRAMARTILDEVLKFRPDYIEHQLGHAVRDPNGRAYNRTAHLEERKKMMQKWADYLDGLKSND